MRLRRRTPDPEPDRARTERDHETRLADAETRVSAVLRTATLVRAAVARRDQENHWRESVDQLFLGGA